MFFLQSSTGVGIKTAIKVLARRCSCLGSNQSESLENIQFQWNSVIAQSSRSCPYSALSLYNQMRSLDIPPNNHTFAPLLKACATIGDLPTTIQVQAQILQLGLASNPFVIAALIDAHGKCGHPESAVEVFDELRTRAADPVIWTAVISALSRNDRHEQAFRLFTRMRRYCDVDCFTLCALLSHPPDPSSHPDFTERGRQIHALAVMYGFQFESRLGNTLIHMYARGEALDDASKAFSDIPTEQRDVVGWNSLISAFSDNGRPERAVSAFYDMLALGVVPTEVTLISVLKACAEMGSPETCRRLNDYVVKNHSSLVHDEIAVSTAMVDMNARSGDLGYACQLFDKIRVRNVVCWSAMIAGCELNMDYNEALRLFWRMLNEVKPNEVTMVSVIAACSGLGASWPGRMVHGYVLVTGLDRYGRVNSALIDMYAKCGDIISARRVFCFTDFAIRNVVTWSAIIAAEGLHGEGMRALSLFSEMLQHGVAANEVTYVSLLSACSHSGLVKEGLSYFESMEGCHAVPPGTKHYACVVDLLARSGRLVEALDFIRAMPIQADVAVWGSLLAACRLHGDPDIGKIAEKEIICLDPSSVGHQVLLANIYYEAGKLEDAIRTRVTMKKSGLKKTAGCSFLEIGNEVYSFVAEDRSRSDSGQVYKALQDLDEQLKSIAGGYNIAIEALTSGQYHSERLAIAFALMLMGNKNQRTIKITKNLRVCKDCHDYTKLVAAVCHVELIVRDARRFHHFKGATCSCGDYW